MIQKWFEHPCQDTTYNWWTVQSIVNSFADDVFNHQIWKQMASIPFQDELKKEILFNQ